MLQKISNLHQKCFPNKPWSADDFAELQKSGCEIIASDNGFIVWRTVLDEAELITIGVNPDVRSSGIAVAMIGIMESELKKLNVKKIFLEVAENNIPALKLYEKNGFKQIAIRPKYYNGVDAIVMEKIL
jgi:ribosomal-protein-alanine N-acetyltransferase